MNYSYNPFRSSAHLTEKVKTYLNAKCRIWITGFIILLILLPVIILLHPKPPLRIICQSRLALHQANTTEAEAYSPALLQSAQNSWKSLLQEWRRQNDKLFFNRNYQRLALIAIETSRLALQSETRSKQTCDSLEVVILSKVTALNRQLSLFREQYKGIPIDDNVRRKYVQSEIVLYECQSALKRGDFNRAVTYLNNAVNLLGETDEAMNTQMGSYLSNIPNWSRWAEETIDWSKTNHDVAILVDKMAHSCRIYNDGILFAEYMVELGPNWIGHKNQRGDCRTPEGKYFVLQKKENGSTIYYKALEIDYPNNTDLALFAEAKRKGWIPDSAEIGGYIELHGYGGQKADWTNGCIALHNKDMDQIFTLAKVGTPVTIVGSLRALKN
jgi:murein L,D-transpeptidase YafK